MEKNNIFKSRKFKYGTASSVIVVLFILGAIVVNMMMATLSEKITTSIDLTQNKVFNLTSDSKKFLSNLEQDIEIVVLNDEGIFEAIDKYTTQANKVIKQYAKNSEKVKISYVDTTKNPTYLSSYKDEKLNANSVIVKTENKYKVLSVEDLFDIQQTSYYGGSKIIASKAENAVTSAMLYVSSVTQTKVALINGYNESDTSSLINLLESNNFEVVDVQILSEEIPQDATAVFVFGPEKDYDDIGIEKINKFMDNNGQRGKNLFVASNYLNQKPVILNQFLDNYGIKIGEGVMFENNQSLLLTSNPLYFLIDYVNQNYVNKSDSDTKIGTRFSVPLEISESKKVESLFKTSSQSMISFQKSNDNMPSATIGAVSSENDSKVFVLGSVDFLGKLFLDRSSLGNSQYFTNIFKTMRSENDNTSDINIQPVSLESKDLGINRTQSNLLGVLFILIIPAIVVIVGISVILIRRNRSRLI